MIESHIDHQARLIDVYRDSLNVYWGSLLTINGILLTFFSIDSMALNGHWVILNYLLVSFCVLSMWLIVFNFRAIKKNYQELGSSKPEDMPDIPEDVRKEVGNPEELKALIFQYSAQWREKEIQKANKRNKLMALREKIFEWLLLAETLLVLSIVIARNCG